MTTISSLLTGQVSGVEPLLDILVPPLHLLGLINDHPQLILDHSSPSESAASSSSSEEAHKLLKRQIALVQLAILSNVWNDWYEVLQQHEKGLGDIVLARYLVPPITATLPDIPAKLALSSYSVIRSVLSPSKRRKNKHVTSSSDLNPQTLQLAQNFLVQLNARFNLRELHQAVFTPSAPEDEGEEGEGDRDKEIQEDLWNQSVKELAGIPTLVANAVGTLPSTANSSHSPSSISYELIWSNYFTTFSQSFVSLLTTSTTASIASLALPLTHLLQHSPSLFSPNPTITPIFTHLIPSIVPPPFPAAPDSLIRRSRIAKRWRRLLAELGGRESTRIGAGLVAVLNEEFKNDRTAGSDEKGLEDRRKRVRGTAWLARELGGALMSTSMQGISESATGQEEDDEYRTPLDLVLDSNKLWYKEFGIVVVDWAERSESGSKSTKVREALLEQVVKRWADEDRIKKGLVGGHEYLSTLLLFLIYSLPIRHPSLTILSTSAPFLTAISTYLTILQPYPRLLGMLVAEVLSERTVKQDGELKPLNFGEIWEGEQEEKKKVKELRQELKTVSGEEKEVDGWQEMLRKTWGEDKHPVKPAPPQRAKSPMTPSSVSSTPPTLPQGALKRPLISIIGEEDDESLAPYPLPADPPQSYLSTLASEDSSEYTTALPPTTSSTTRRRGKLRAPVYIPELVAYLKGKDPEGGEEQKDQEAERVEVGLREGEGLVRRKKGWGGEVDENAVDLAFALMGLQDQFETEGFEEFKLKILAALVVASPTKTAPAVIEQYFMPHYTIAQRQTILTALALASRELANLSLPIIVPGTKTSYQLPPGSGKTQQVELFPSKQLPPALHRRLMGVGSATVAQHPSAPPRALTPGALEQITSQLTNSALSDAKSEAEATIPEAAREKLLTVRRFKSTSSNSSSNGSGNGPTTATFSQIAAEFFILPFINRFWSHLRDVASTSNGGPFSGRGGANSASLLEPMVLSRYFGTMGIMLHAARFSPHFLAVLSPEAIELVMGMRTEELDGTEQTVLEAEMELLLVVLDAVVALDGGYTLVRTVNGGGELLAGVKDWAEQVFEREEERTGGTERGGIGRAGRAAAGILLRLDEVFSKVRGTLGWQ
ncbi:hypothetical protein T439DRAFT_128186 [Meredithblackwellia eburnea MCA 4105]